MYRNWRIKISELTPELEEEEKKVAEWCNQNQEYRINDDDEYIFVEKKVPHILTYEEVKQSRINYRKENIDDITLERQRKTANGTWTSEDESAYLRLDAEVTAWIEENLSYPVDNNE